MNPDAMTSEKAMARLKEIYDTRNTRRQDIEGDHVEADQILCDLLISLGHSEVVKWYNLIYKWYA